jgi:hypothetical protein
VTPETAELLDRVRADQEPATGRTFSPVMVRALLRCAKTQTSRMKRWPVGVGSLVYVREAFHLYGAAEDRILYRASSPGTSLKVAWKPSIHMPKWAARILLRITHEPYQKAVGLFDEKDTEREGCPIPGDDPELPEASFDDVWFSIHGESEPGAVVWVHRFEVLR